jgi:hypothetical protein
MEPKVYFPMMSSGENILFCKKGIAAIFTLLCRYFSITVAALIIFPHLPFLRSDTNHRKVTSNVVKKENKAFCLISDDDLFIFFTHSSTLAYEI